MASSGLMLITAIILVSCWSVTAKFGDKISIKEKDIMRKSIVFDKKTPDVFYCPMQKPSSMNKLIVRSRPLHKLCEYEGQALPEDYKSDCYLDMDESDFACKEKYRIMMRMHPPGSEAPYNGTSLKRFMEMDSEIKMKMENFSNNIKFHDVVAKL